MVGGLFENCMARMSPSHLSNQRYILALAWPLDELHIDSSRLLLLGVRFTEYMRTSNMEVKKPWELKDLLRIFMIWSTYPSCLPCLLGKVVLASILPNSEFPLLVII